MSKGKRILEWGKNLLIVLLLCSALWLLADSQLFGHLPWKLEGQQSGTAEQMPAPAAGPVTFPMAVAVTNRSGMCATRYDMEAINELFRPLTSILGEAIAGAVKPEPVQPEQWHAALTTPDNIWLELQGNVPMQVLCRWLAETDNAALTGSARQILLCAEQEQVRLYYRKDEKTGYACAVETVTAEALREAVSHAVPNGAGIAAGHGEYEMLAPQTLILADTPEPMEYNAYNPLEGEAELDALLQSLSFAPGITSVYQAPEGWRARSGNDTLTVSNEGRLDYERVGDEQRYPLAGNEGESAAYRAVETARQLVCGIAQRWGGTSVYLLDARQDDAGWHVEFGYVVNGIAVQFGEQKACATVLVDSRGVASYEMILRGYRSAGKTALILPQPQAAAVLEQMGQAGHGLLLNYLDSGETVRVGWMAD